MKAIQKNLTDLKKRLHAVLPEYRPISEFNGQPGTFKAICGEGNVYLVRWETGEALTAKRSEKLVMDYFTLCRKSDEAISDFRPEDGWDM